VLVTPGGSEVVVGTGGGVLVVDRLVFDELVVVAMVGPAADVLLELVVLVLDVLLVLEVVELVVVGTSDGSWKRTPRPEAMTTSSSLQLSFVLVALFRVPWMAVLRAPNWIGASGESR